MDYLEGLNDAQREAVVHTEGPSMVIAGAGSGKTRVLTYRIAHLINNGVDPYSILALTFTNKAAREMRERIMAVVGESKGRAVMMGTFHSVFSRVLRAHADKLGYPSNFTIYDTQDSRSVIKAIIKEFNLDDKIYKPSLVQGRISAAKNNLLSAAMYAADPDIIAEDRMSKKPRLHEIFKIYEQRCFKAGAMDFDDLLFKMNILLHDFPEVLYHYQHKFKYVLVDEYQDTNYAQYVIVKKLAALNENICVVGDDAQSIYAFRGANIQNILNFKNDYPDYQLFKLEQNYRSTGVIVNAANSVIANNKDQIKKHVWTDNAEGNKIKVIKTLTDNEEGLMIADMIYETRVNQQAQPLDFAILYRTNSQSRSFEEALRKLNIPYKIYGGQSFYQRKEIKDILGYFRLSCNPNDDEAFKRIINYPKRGIGKTTVESMIVGANTHGVSLWEIAQAPDQYQVKISSGAKTKIGQFVTMVQSYMVQLDKVGAFELAQFVAQNSGLLKDLYADKTPEGVSRYENVQELLAGIKEFSVREDLNEDQKRLPDFLMDVALLTDADAEKEEDKNTVSLMTVHASKGLEFPYVYIVGMEENLFPSQLSVHSRAELEEERRLFYVAVTRAKKQAVLSYAGSRFRWGQPVYNEPSRFITEISPEFLEQSASYGRKPAQSKTEDRPWGGLGSGPKKFPSRKNLRPVGSASPAIGTTDILDLKVGQNVSHEKFGKGKVVGLQGEGADTKATIFFPRIGQKQLLLRFAKLEVLE